MWNVKNQSEYKAIKHVLVKHPRDAYQSQAVADASWKDHCYPGPISFTKVMDEFEGFIKILEKFIPKISYLPPDPGTGLDSIYTHDPTVPTNKGIILLNMGKPQRAGEPAAAEKFFKQQGIPIIGRLEGVETHEGGDSVWIDDNTLAIGVSFRTSPEGVKKIQQIAGNDFEVIPYGLPYWNGPDECLHIMSFISPIDKDLAVVYSKQMPIPFRNDLIRRGYKFIEVPDEEYATFGPNVLAIAPRVVVIPCGNPVTVERLKKAGCEVYEMPAFDITYIGGGGPTCLTRALERE